MPYVNNKGADHPAHPSSLINAFVVCCLDGIIYILAKSIARLCSWAGLFESYPVKNPEDMFSRDEAQLFCQVDYSIFNNWTRPFSFKGDICTLSFLFVWSLIRCCILCSWLIWIFTVCLGPIDGTLDTYGFSQCFFWRSNYLISQHSIYGIKLGRTLKHIYIFLLAFNKMYLLTLNVHFVRSSCTV